MTEIRTQARREQVGCDRDTETIEVLYQRLGDRWFAFSVIEDEVFFGKVPEDRLNHASLPRTRKIAGRA